jgi:RNA polymerase sigma-70 factor (ECF subfamily)
VANDSPHLSDPELIATILKGEQERFRELVERYQGRLVNFLYRLLHDRADAEDLAQDVFLKVYQALDRYDPKYKFSTWLFRVAQNAAIDQLRKRRLKMVSMDRPSSVDRDAGTWEFPGHERSQYARVRNDERSDAIREAIEELPWEYRELIAMRHFGELSYDQIATVKKMPLGTVKNKLFRGRQMLKAKLEDYLVD